MSASEQEARRIFSEALALGAQAERDAFVEHACGDDKALREEVKSLLQAHAQAGDFLARHFEPPIDLMLERPGTEIGRYKLLERIGEGGFGVVWMAEQREPMRRLVALKIIKAGMDSQEVIARFEAERQALALMDHPNIARVLDAGATESGRPYFVMELVRGVPVTEYCDQNHLSTPDRLELLIQVCHALQHAHQKGIIHRDVKPSNVLVTVQDSRPLPKVIDFGVAKAMGHKLTQKTFFTGFAQMVGTPAYMSPEQAGLGSFDIDTRSDVYSLGVLLYELLTGKPPFEPERLREAGFDEMRRVIREEEPSKPSTRLSTLSEQDLSKVAEQRQAEPPDLLRTVRGDLDWIVMKALDKDRSRRYETVAGLAADLRRFLDVEPVEARPPGTLYLLNKMVRRHRVGFTAGAGVLVSLLGGLALSTLLFLQERAAKRTSLEQKQRADEQAALAASINEFLQRDLLAHGAPEVFSEEKPEPDLKVRTVLDRASEKIEGQFPRQPLVEAGLRMTLGRAYHGLGEYATQERHVRRAFDIYRRQLGQANAETLAAARALGDAKRHLGLTNEALRLLQQTFEISRGTLGAHHTNTLSAMSLLATIMAEGGQTNAASEVMQKAVELANQDPGPESAIAAYLLNNLAAMQSQQRKWHEAIENCRRLVKLQRKLSGTNGLSTARAESALASVLAGGGKLAEAEPIARQALEALRGKLGPEHPEVRKAMLDLARCARELGRLPEAETLFRELVAMESRVHGEGHAGSSWPLYYLARTLQGQGKLAEAEEVYRRDYALERRLNGADGEETLTAAQNLLQVLLQEQKFLETEELANQIAESYRRKDGLEHPNTLSAQATLGLVYVGQDKMGEATKLLSETLKTQSRVLGPENTNALRTMFILASAHLGQGEVDKFDGLIDQLLPIQARVLGPEHPETLATVTLRAMAYLDQNKPALAEPLFKGLLEIRIRAQGTEGPETLATMQLLARADQSMGERTKALQLYNELLPLQLRILGADDPNTLRTRHDLAHLYSSGKDFVQAARAREELLPDERRVLGHDHRDTLCTLNRLGYDYLDLDRLDEARGRFAELLKTQQRVMGPHALETEETRDALAECLALQGKEADAATLYADKLDGGGERGSINRVVVAATVNGRPIFEAEVRQAGRGAEDRLRRDCGAQPEVLRQKLWDLRKVNLEQLIDRHLIAREFFRARHDVPKAETEAEVARQVASQYNGDTNVLLRTLAATGITLDEFRRNLERQWIERCMRQSKLLNLPAPAPAQVEEYYQAHQAEFRVQDSVNLGLIVLNMNRTNTTEAAESRRKLAEEIRARLAQGGDFAELARLYSEGTQARSGGDWGWVEISILRRELGDAVRALPPGTISEVIETPDAFYIMRIKERRAAFVRPLAEVQNQIQQQLTLTQRVSAEQQWLRALRRNAVIKSASGKAGDGGNSREKD